MSRDVNSRSRSLQYVVAPSNDVFAFTMNKISLDSNDRPKTAVISCSVLEAEIEHFAANLEHIVRIENLEQGLHNEPTKLRNQLQEAIERIEEETPAETILLGYGLCSRGTEGVRTGRCRMIVPRAHDCITLLLGCKRRYAEYVAEHPGTYWYSPGWNKHHVPPGPERHEKLYQEYREQFGEDDAKYLMETAEGWFSSYERAAYVDLGVGVTDEDLEYTCKCADWLGWTFDHQHGDPDLLRALLEGRWDTERFVVLRPGQTFRMTGDERVIEATDA